ncbi:MAG TPA: OmpA family protein [Gemmatimonadales bacterium]|nr:OmpA family protein [Gemmatimonadales bacterium]
MLSLVLTSPAAAQRKYLIEVGAAGALMSFDNATDLGTGYGGLGRLGLWLPLNFELEAEGSVFKPKTKTSSIGVSTSTFGGSLLYNIPVGLRNFAYLKAGLGTTSYGSCPTTSTPNAPICGSATAITGGAGFRAAIAPTVMIRLEGMVNRNKSTDKVTDVTTTFANFGANLGLSFMLGSRPVKDSDGDGVLDSTDKCPDTPPGVLVDKDGCPRDNDKDGVPDGIDRCPNTQSGVKVDATGCAVDSDKDGVPDGLDKCPDTPPGAAVNANGCPLDADRDGVPDGLDRCPDTPRGATVDALGCPSDSDGDGVLDGLDKCPNTPPNTPVDANGCGPGQSAAPSEKPPAPQGAPPPAERPAPAAPAPTPRAAAAPKSNAPPDPVVLRDQAFALGSARLRSDAFPVLDSVVTRLRENPSLRLEIGGHTANSRSEADSRQLASLRVEAVRSYLIGKGVRPQRLVPKVYGPTVPLTADTSAVGRATNRRIEITPLPGGP